MRDKLKQLWRRSSFWSFLLALVTVVPLASLVKEPVVRPALVPLAYIYSFVLTAMLMFVLFNLRNVMGMLRPPKDVAWQEMPADFLELAMEMGVASRIKKYGEVPGWNNAAAVPIKGELFVGEKLLSSMSRDDALAVIAHELAHFQQYRRWTSLALIGLLMILASLSMASYQYDPLMVRVPAQLSLMGILAWAVRWRMEYDADRTAAKYVPAVAMVSAFESIEPDAFERTLASFTHPPMSWRIRRLIKRAKRKSGPGHNSSRSE